MHGYGFGTKRIVVALALVGLLTLPAGLDLLAAAPAAAETELPGEPNFAADPSLLMLRTTPSAAAREAARGRATPTDADVETALRVRREVGTTIAFPPVHILYGVRRE